MAAAIDVRFQADERFGVWTVFDRQRGLHIEHEAEWTEAKALFVAERLNETQMTVVWTWANDREEVVG